MASYEQALKLKPDWVEALNDLGMAAGDRAAGRIAGRHPGSAAGRAGAGFEGGKEARFWGTLDAAYAEAGRFGEAISAAEKTRELALAGGQKEIAQAAEQRLALYRRQQPYRQQAGSNIEH